MYTKEQLLNAKEILLNLISDDRELDDSYFGICFNVHHHNLNNTYIDGYDLVTDLSKGWKHHTGGNCWMVPDNYSLGKWEGKNLELRIDLMKHIISKIDEMLEEM